MRPTHRLAAPGPSEGSSPADEGRSAENAGTDSSRMAKCHGKRILWAGMSRPRFSTIGLALVLAVLAALPAGTVSAAARAESPGPSALPDYGVVTISADGVVSNPAAPISVSGTTYAITSSFAGSLAILANDVTLYGGGNTVAYAVGDGAAVSVNETAGVTITSLVTSGGSFGLWANGTSGLKVLQTTFGGASEAAVNVTNSTGTTLAADTFAHGPGVVLWNATEAEVVASYGNYSTSGIQVFGGSAVTIEDDQLAYITNGTGAALNLTGVTGATITSSSTYDSPFGLQLYQSRELSVDGNNLSRDGFSGVDLERSSNAQIDGNTAVQDGSFVLAGQSSNLSIQGNDAEGALNAGLDLRQCDGVTAVENRLETASPYETNEAVQVDGSDGINLTADDGGGTMGMASFWIFESENVALVADNGTPMAGPGIAILSSEEVQLIGDWANGTNGPEILGSVNVTVVDDAFVRDVIGLAVLSSTDVVVRNDNLSRALGTGVYIDTSENVSLADVNLSGATDDGLAVASSRGRVAVVDSNLSDATEDGLRDAGGNGTLTVDADRFDADGEVGIATDATNGSVILTDNSFLDAPDGIAVNNAAGNVSLTENRVRGASGTAIEVGNSSGPLLLSGNDAEGSAVALNLSDCSSSALSEVLANNLSSASTVKVYDDRIGAFVGNDLLGDAAIALVDSTFTQVDHNDFASSGFDAAGSTAYLGTWNQPYPVGGNYWTGYAGVDRFSGPAQNVPGSDGIGDTPYTIGSATDDYPLMVPWYAANLTFTEDGLPAGLAWSVTVNGVTESSVAGTPIVFAEANGAATSYVYVASGPADYLATPAQGGGVEADQPEAVTIGFSLVVYALAFTESGLAAGTSWSLSVDGVAYVASGTTLVLLEPNATYTYAAGPVDGYTVAGPGAGTVTIAGANAAVTIGYSAVEYGLTFTETGLLPGTPWRVTVDGVAHVSTASTLVVAVPNGTHTYAVGGVSGLAPSPPSGTFAVAGGAPSIAVTFTPVTYTVTFVEVGLPSGRSWSVTMDGATHRTTGTNLTFAEGNATYAYAVAVGSGYGVSPAASQVTVFGGNVTVYLRAAPSGLSGLAVALAAGLGGATVLAAVGWVLWVRQRRQNSRGGSAGAGGPAVDSSPGTRPPS